MRIAFLLPEVRLAGGIGVVLEHARQLRQRHGHDVTLVITQDRGIHWRHPALAQLEIADIDDLPAEPFDIAIATWWQTCWRLYDVPAARHAYFVQSMEERFYPAGQFERLLAGLTHVLPVPVITEARWIADQLRERAPWRPVHYVRNGIDKDVFTSPQAAPLRPATRPLHILVEGHGSWFKGLDDAMASLALMQAPHRATLVSSEPPDEPPDEIDEVLGPLHHAAMATTYAEHDVLLKLSRVEGMFGPPLEAFHMGATAVVTPVTGYDEYIRHGVNALVADFDDHAGTARLLDLLAADRRLLHELRAGALHTARAWPSWTQSGDMMALALDAIRREPPLARPEVGAALMRDGLGAGWPVHRHLVRLESDYVRAERDVGNVIGEADRLRAELYATGDTLQDVREQHAKLTHSREMVVARLATPVVRSRPADLLARILAPIAARRRARRPRD